MTTKRLLIAFLAAAVLGLAAVIGFTVLSGLDYRNQESQGQRPGYTPEWIVAGTYAGLGLMAVAVVALAALGCVVLVKQARRRREGHPTITHR
ncbi:hypothetical protein [Frigoribacterium sp. ME-P-080]|uniref:hypothetical protein n=1 Tax=Frigoribacterium sp. ME-P-080 TaxID=3040289 RepID=UPI00254C2C2E|nr:hypothetical protein [Frigoribacterium sp. ME-P-080]